MMSQEIGKVDTKHQTQFFIRFDFMIQNCSMNKENIQKLAPKRDSSDSKKNTM